MSQNECDCNHVAEASVSLAAARDAHGEADGLKRFERLDERVLGVALAVDALGHLVAELVQRDDADRDIHPEALEDRPNLVGISVRDYVVSGGSRGDRLVREEFVEGTPEKDDDPGRRVDFVYDHPDEGIQQRAVLPGEVKIGRNGEYVVAFDLDRNEWRNFRLDRVIRARGSWR